MSGQAEDKRTDEALMLAFRATLDEPSLEELMRRYYAAGLRLAEHRLRDRTLAEEAVQDAFLRVVRHRHRFDPRRRFGPWFFAILFKRCEDYRRKQARYQARLEALAPFADPPPVANSMAERLPAALETLPSLDREVLLLRFAQGASFARIAEILGVSAEAAKKRAQRALQRLRALLVQGT